MINILKQGQTVFVGNQSNRTMEAEITAIMIREERVTYEVTWWYEGNCRTAWLPETEMEFKNKKEYETIGFSNSSEKEENK